MSLPTEVLLLQVDVQANNARLVELQKSLNDNKLATAALNAAFKEGKLTADEYAAGQVRLKQSASDTTQEMRVLTKANADQKKATDEAKGSINQLRAELSRGTAAYNALSQSERENTEAGQKLQAQNKALSDQLKALEKAVGDTRRNVGNYKEDVIGALRETNLFGVNVGQTADNLKGNLQTGLNLAKAGFGSLKAAIISTGLGALVVLLGSVYEYLKKSDEGAEKLAGIMAGFGEGINVVTGYVIKFGEFLFNAFDKPKVAIANIGKFLAEIVANPRKAFTDFVNNLETGFSRVTTQIKAAYAEGVKVSALNDKLEDAEIAAIKRNAEAEKQIGRLTLSAKDRSLSEEKRLANLAKADELEKQVLNRNLAVEQQRLSIIERKNKQDAANNKLQDDDRRKQEEQIAKISQLQGAAAEAQQARQNRRAALIEEIAAQEKAAIDAATAAENARLEAAAKRLEAEDKARILALQREERDRKEKAAADEAAFQEQEGLLDRFLARMRSKTAADYASGAINKQDYDAALELQERISYASRLMLATKFGKDTAKLTEDTAKAELAAQEKAKNQKKRIKDVEIGLVEAGTQAGALATDAVISALGQETEAGQTALTIKKGLALAEIGISLQKQLAANAEAGAKISAEAPPLTIPLGVAYTTTQNVLAFAQAALGAATVLAFNKGGVVPGSGSGDTVPAMLTPGEVVMTKAASVAYAPLLSHLNASMGGTPFHYATGGIAGQRSAPIDGGFAARALSGQLMVVDPAQFVAALERANIDVSVRNIDRAKARNDKPRIASTLG